MKKTILLLALFVAALTINAQTIQNTFMKCTFGMTQSECQASLYSQGFRVNKDYTYNTLSVTSPGYVRIGGVGFEEARLFFNRSNEFHMISYHNTFSDLSLAKNKFYELRDKLKKTYPLQKDYEVINKLNFIDDYEYRDDKLECVRVSIYSSSDKYVVEIAYLNLYYYAKEDTDEF